MSHSEPWLWKESAFQKQGVCFIWEVWYTRNNNCFIFWHGYNLL